MARQVLVYVRRSEKPVIDSHLIERLQREVGQLRGLIIKLKESSTAATAFSAIHNEEIPKRFHGMNLVELVERVEIMEEESKRDKAEVRGGEGG